MVRVIITGGMGFIGRSLASLILKRGTIAGADGSLKRVSAVTLFDTPDSTETGKKYEVLQDSRVEVITGDIGTYDECKQLVDGTEISIFHMASIMSGKGEEDFDLCHKVNLTGTLNLLEACRARGDCPRFVFCSSIAVFGPQACVDDQTKHNPETTYGCTKAISELLVNDYSRRGFVNGRSARLPTVIVRPGEPNAATTSCFSGVIREPLHGEECILPVDPSLYHPITSERSLVEGLLTLHDVADIEIRAICGIDRAVGMPSISTTLSDLSLATKRVAEAQGIHLGDTKHVSSHFFLIFFVRNVVPNKKMKYFFTIHVSNAHLDGVVSSFCSQTGSERAILLGCPSNPNNIDDIVEAFVEDHVMH